MSNTPASPTVRQMISDVRQDLKSVNLDQWIPAYYIHKKLIDKAGLFIKREADNMKLQYYPDIWVTVDELVMEPSQLVGPNLGVPDCTNAMISVKELPRIFTTRFGYLVNVSSADFSGDYFQTTPRDYNAKRNRRFKNPKQRYFWIYNNHLLVPESFVKVFTLRAIFANKKEGLELNGCGPLDSCIRMLDLEFPAPGHLLDDIKKATIIDIASIREKIPVSEYPHLNENIKVSPQTK